MRAGLAHRQHAGPCDCCAQACCEPPTRPHAAPDAHSIADYKNVGSGGGGSITAALFLKEFVKETPWAHMDIAGPVWNDKAGGATGYGVRTLASFVSSYAKP